jgi:hypothetical protein
MLFAVWVPLLLQLIVPLSLLAWLAFGRSRSRVDWALRVLVVACYLAAMGAGGLWLIMPWYTPLVYAGLFALAAFRSAYDVTSPSEMPYGFVRWAGLGIMVALALLFSGLTVHILRGGRPPANAVELEFPLRNGSYLVVNGGGNELINAHNKTLSGERFRRWRGQSYGVDIEKVNAVGLRAYGLLPKNLPAYEIFGEPVYAPCDGDVIAALDGVQEMTPPEMDRQNMTGNHIILNCGGMWVLLGHLQRGSVDVADGEPVSRGQRLARVGNTGNTGEPHLHIHAQRPGTKAAPISGEPLAIRFGDRYPVRNARLVVAPSNQE